VAKKTKTKHANVSGGMHELSNPRVGSPRVGVGRVSASCPVTNRQPFNGQFQDNLGTPAPERLDETTGWHWHQLDHIQIISTSLQTR